MVLGFLSLFFFIRLNYVDVAAMTRATALLYYRNVT